MLRLALLLGAAASCLAVGLNPELDTLRFNQIQGIATSKSYHLAPADAVLSYLTNKSWAGLAELQIPQAYKYDHLTVTAQLDMGATTGITNFEIWVMDDYQGGLYGQVAGLKLAGLDGNLANPNLQRPGFKLLQMADWDYNSTVYLLDHFVQEVLTWTELYPGHLPLTVVVHPATSGLSGDLVTNAAKLHLAGFTLEHSSVPGPKKFTVPEALGDGTAFNASMDLAKFDATLRSLVPSAKLYTPDNLRLGNATLRDAVFPPSASWPTIGELRGKIMFVADPGYIADYNVAFPNLTNAVMFTSDDQKSDDPNVVFLDVEVDTSILSGIANTFSLSNEISSSANAKVDASAQKIRAKVEEGYMVRTAVDKNLVEQFNNYEYRYKVFAAVGGAHWLMTATEVIQTRLIPGSNYSVNSATVPGFAGRTMICNPVTTNMYLYHTSAVNGSTVATVACPYSATLPAGIVIPQSKVIAAAPASAPLSASTPPSAITPLSANAPPPARAPAAAASSAITAALAMLPTATLAAGILLLVL